MYMSNFVDHIKNSCYNLVKDRRDLNEKNK